MVLSSNGYSANDVNKTAIWPIPGTKRTVRLRNDDCGYLLVHFAAWFDANIEDIETGILDDWGYAERLVRGSTTTVSNHASGTAIDLNAVKHPMGVDRTFTYAQVRAIHRQLRVYGGCIRWGGDYSTRVDAMHYEIDKDYVHVKAIALMLRAGKVVKTVAVRALPLVDLSNVRGQARRPTKSLLGVRRIQKALNARLGTRLRADGKYGPATRSAYADWQRKLHFQGKAANGVPGLETLTKLGARRFRVVS